jgi:CheY-like chemotaxis protein
MQARELAERLKAMRPTLEFIFTSGYSEPMIVERGILESGANFLSKPFSPTALATKVREVLGTPRAANILVVDDVAGIRGLLRKILTGAGYKVIEAADGKQALQQMRTSQVDLVLTDLVMPEMEGIETIRTIHRQWPKQKIIAMSGEFGAQFLHTAELLGANATLSKPIRPDVLLDVVRRVLPWPRLD